jgi:hypothetical protein
MTQEHVLLRTGCLGVYQSASSLLYMLVNTSTMSAPTVGFIGQTEIVCIFKHR